MDTMLEALTAAGFFSAYRMRNKEMMCPKCDTTQNTSWWSFVVVMMRKKKYLYLQDIN